MKENTAVGFKISRDTFFLNGISHFLPTLSVRERKKRALPSPLPQYNVVLLFKQVTIGWGLSWGGGGRGGCRLFCYPIHGPSTTVLAFVSPIVSFSNLLLIHKPRPGVISRDFLTCLHNCWTSAPFAATAVTCFPETMPLTLITTGGAGYRNL